MMSSSFSAIVSTSRSRHSRAASTVSRRNLLDVVVLAELGVQWPHERRISTRSMTPRKSPSAPMGICSASGTAPRRDSIISTQRWNSAPTRSILLTKQIRGHAVAVGLAPHRLGLGLHAGDTVEHGDCAVEDTQRTLDLDGEVDVTGGVDDVDLVVMPVTGRRGRRDRDAALLLLLHPVHRGATLVDLTDLVVDAGVVEDALGRGGLARVDMRHDPDVADLGEVGQRGA